MLRNDFKDKRDNLESSVSGIISAALMIGLLVAIGYNLPYLSSVIH